MKKIEKCGPFKRVEDFKSGKWSQSSFFSWHFLIKMVKDYQGTL